MSKNGLKDDMGVSEIKCGICGFKFDTALTKETHYEGYDPYEVSVLRPVGPKSNPPHLIHDYICDKCYRKFGDVVLNLLKEDCKNYSQHYKKSKDRIEGEYKEKLAKLEDEKKEVEEIKDKLSRVSYLSDVSPELIEEMKFKFSHLFSTYYLDVAYANDMKKRKHMCSRYDWECEYGIEGYRINYPFKVDWSKKLTLKKYKELLEDSEIRDMSFKEFKRLINRIEEDIKKLGVAE